MEDRNTKESILLSYLLARIMSQQIRLSDTQLLIILFVVLLLLYYQFSHATGVPTSIEIDWDHDAID